MSLKKVISLGLAAAISLLSFAACSNTNDGSTSAETPAAAQVDGSDEPSSQLGDTGNEEIVEVIWQFPSTGNLGAGFNDVEDAINAMMGPDIGVHVRLEPVGLMDAQQEAVLMVSAGEQLDIMLTAFTGIGPVVEKGLILPLDDLLEEHGAAIWEHVGAKLYGCAYGQNIYGVTTGNIVSDTYGYMIREDLCEKYDIEIDPDKYYTVEDLEEIFAIVKAGEGDRFYCTIPWNTTEDPLNNSYMEYDKVTGNLSGGVLMLNRDFNTSTFENLFATEEYAQYVEMMYRWAQNGYISPDAAVTTETPETLLNTGNFLGEFYWNDPLAEAEVNAGTSSEYTFKAVNMIPAYVSNTGGEVIQWNIPITSANPEKAMQALNYIYENKECAWLFQYGIEGESYEVIEETEYGKVIQYLSDDLDSLPYHQVYGIYGDRLEWPALFPKTPDSNVIQRAYDDAVPQSRYSPALGYSFIQESVSAEIAAVNTVVDQYTPSFNSGALNPENALPEMLSALEAAGINKIIEENQRQYDEWLAGKTA